MSDVYFNADGEYINLEEEVQKRLKEIHERERRQKEEWKAKQEGKKRRSKISFVNNDMDAVELMQSALTRAQRGLFVLLTCYLNYDNKLVYYNRGDQPLNKGDIANVLNCSPSTANEFVNICIDYGIMRFDEVENAYYVNPSVSFKGGYSNMERTVVSVKKEVKRLAKALTPTQLGLLYDIQPYINRKYHVLCMNPEETRWEYVQQQELKPASLARELGMDEKHLNKQLAKMKVDGKMVVQKIGYGKKCRYLVNPNFIFRGDFNKAVETIRTMYNEKTFNTIFSEVRGGDESASK